MSKGLKVKLRSWIAKGLKWAAPKIADAVADEVRRRAGAPPAGSGPWTKSARP